MQSERFADAEAELQQVIADFPAIAGLDQQAKALRQLGAERVLTEVEMRHKAGQYGVAYGMLGRFPPTGISGTTLQAVRDKIEKYRAAQQKRNATIRRARRAVGASERFGRFAGICSRSAMRLPKS